MSSNGSKVPTPMESYLSKQRLCTLMFSGGRDSTLAAVRLLRQRYRLILVTVSSDHLIGVDRVKRRIEELRSIASVHAVWIHLAQPATFTPAMNTAHQTCLPCHAVYAALGYRIAVDNQTPNLAFGYVGYQAHWLEQTPQAINIMQYRLRDRGINLLLPVSDVSSKSQAVRQLQDAGLTHGALEQKCLKQQLNVTLSPPALTAELQRWDRALERSLDLAADVDITPAHRVDIEPEEPFGD